MLCVCVCVYLLSSPQYDANKNEELEEEELVHFLSDLRTTLVKAIGASGKEAAVRAADQLNEVAATCNE